ncbi:MAG: hypothetical protein PHI85_02000 [Victivallaceae bacterium]|nr:hypothetical protein [Victivallaceae bacterium]
MKELLNRFYRESEYPALAEQAAEWAESRPLAGVRVLDGTPLFRNTLTKYVALLSAGAELSVAVNPNIPFDRGIAGYIESRGIRVLSAPGKELKFDMVLDCAGCNAEVESKFGYVELTRSGEYRYRDCARPVLSADASRIKEIETVLGTGDGWRRAMIASGHGDFSGKKVVIFGCGKVGRGIALYAFREGADVTMIDDASKVAFPAFVRPVDMHDPAAIELAVGGAWCVISVTGVRNAWCGRFDPSALLASESLIVNMGVEDEFGPAVPESRVMNRKRPLNFMLEEPTKLKYIEATLALHNAAAVLLAGGGFPAGVSKIPAAVERKILDRSIAGGEIGDEIKELERL